MSAQTMAAMTASDIDEVLEIERALFSHPWQRNSFLSELEQNDARTFVVRHEDCQSSQKIIAYVAFRLILDEMHLLKIAVAKRWQHRGIATWLLENSMKQARKEDATAVLLEVRVSNTRAITFYEQFGFQTIAKRPNYYAESREDALIMLNNLKEVDYEY